MLPLETIDRVTTPEGKELVLYERAGIFHIRVDGLELMASEAHGSEDALAKRTCADLPGPTPKVLLGGLGMGYTLRAALDVLPPKAEVRIAEFFEAVVRWNRGPLGHLAKRPLDDPRAEVIQEDIARVIRRWESHWDAILLDVDNGPEAFTLDANQALYGRSGMAAFFRALKPGGRLSVWSADPSPPFVRLLEKTGFEARAVSVAARVHGGGPKHTLFLARRPKGGGPRRGAPKRPRSHRGSRKPGRPRR